LDRVARRKRYGEAAAGGHRPGGPDKITTVPKARLGKRIGKLNDEDVVRLNRALTVFLGLAR
jgi:mRNA-degrading endonuclease toxin of MazEF toxin-antitoxin module